MNIRRKTVVMIGLTVVILVAVIYVVAQRIMLDNVLAAERREVENDVRRFESSLNFELSGLSSTAQDWAAWDDTYVFAQDNNTEFVDFNLMEDTFTNLKLDVIVVVNSAYQIVFGETYDSDTQTLAPIPESLAEHCRSDDFLVRQDSAENSLVGVLLLPEGAMLVASHPILTSMHEEPIQGTLVMGRYVKTEEASLSKIVGVPYTTYAFNDPALPADFRLANASLAGGAYVFAKPVNETYMGGYAFVRDIYDSPALIVRLEETRDNYQQGASALLYFVVSLFVWSIVLVAVTILLLEKFVLLRLSQLSHSVIRIGEKGSPTDRVPVSGNDELSSLASNINGMLDTIAKARLQIKKHAEHLEEKVEERTRNLRESQEKMRSILSASPNAITATDLNANIVECNQQTVRMHGYRTREEMIGSSALDLLAERERQRAMAHLKRTMEGELVTNAEYVLLRKDGSEFPAELSASRVLDAAGNPIGFVSVARDITERKLSEQRVLKSERLAAIGELAGMVGHDLRNPLTGIASAAYYLRAKYGRRMDSRGMEMLDIIEKDVRYSDKIINDLLEYSGDLKPVFSQTTPKALLAEALSGIDVPPNILVNDATEDTPKIMLDTAKMRRVFVNLIKNAIDAMPRGGELTVESRQEGERLLLSFRDTGIGISQDNLGNLWRPFYTTKAKGMGFGLPICRRIVEAHGGSISVESTFGKGSVFTVSLPLEPKGQQNDSISLGQPCQKTEIADCADCVTSAQASK